MDQFIDDDLREKRHHFSIEFGGRLFAPFLLRIPFRQQINGKRQQKKNKLSLQVGAKDTQNSSIV